MTLDVEDKAPDFSASTDGGETISLKALKGRKIILYFYPKDDTSDKFFYLIKNNDL